jgi:hypothetical protein
LSEHHDPHHQEPFIPAPWPPGEVSESQKWSIRRLTVANGITEPYDCPASKQLLYLIFYLIQIMVISWAAFNLL